MKNIILSVRRLLPMLFIVLLLHITFFSCSHKGDSCPLPSLPDTVNVAVELSAMTLTTNGDTISGFSFELMEAILVAHRLPYKLTVYNNINDAIEQAEEKGFNLFVSNIPVTTQLKEDFLVTHPLYIDRQVLVQNMNHPADSLIHSQQELGNRLVWVVKGSPIVERLQNLSKEIGNDIIIVEVDDVSEEQLVIMVSLGELPRAAVSSLTAESLQTIYPHLDIKTDLSFNQFKSWFLLPNDSLLRDSLDVWINDFKQTPEYEGITKKYSVKTI